MKAYEPAGYLNMNVKFASCLVLVLCSPQQFVHFLYWKEFVVSNKIEAVEPGCIGEDTVEVIISVEAVICTDYGDNFPLIKILNFASSPRFLAISSGLSIS